MEMEDQEKIKKEAIKALAEYYGEIEPSCLITINKEIEGFIIVASVYSGSTLDEPLIEIYQEQKVILWYQIVEIYYNKDDRGCENIGHKMLHINEMLSYCFDENTRYRWTSRC